MLCMPMRPRPWSRRLRPRADGLSFAFLQIGTRSRDWVPTQDYDSSSGDMTLIHPGLGPLGPPKTRLIIRPRLIIAVSGQKGKSDDTHCASGTRTTDLRDVRNRSFRSGRPDYKSRPSHAADPESDDHHVSDHL